MADPSPLIDRGELVKHLDGVRRLARSLVRDDAEADDVMQDAAVAALENRTPVRRGLRAWLGGVTRNVVRTRHRVDTRRDAREAAVAKPEAVPSVAESVVRAAEQSALLETVVNMQDPYRTAILLRFVEGLPPREIATRMDIPVETVRTHVKRGLTRLRAHLDRRHGGRDMWRASLFLVAGGVPHAAPAAAGGAAAKKLLLVSGTVVAAGLAAWWVWTLATEEPSTAQPPIDIVVRHGAMGAGDEDDPLQDRTPIVVRDEGADPVPTDLRGSTPPPSVIEPELGERETESSSTPPVTPPVVRSDDTPTLEARPAPAPPRIPSGVTGRLLRDTTGGRVDVPGAAVWIGTPFDWIDGITKARRGRVPIGFALEAPRHLVEVEPFAIDLFEVTNAQYHRYLQLDSKVIFEVDRRNRGNLTQIARRIVRRDVPRNLDWDVVARQIYESNFGVLHAQHPHTVVRRQDGSIDPERTWARMQRTVIRRGVELVFYDRAPPGYWRSMAIPKGLAAHPVRDVSYQEAQAFAMWAGKHIPSEIEWEYATRGAQGAAYPWGGKPTRWETRVNGGFALPRGEEPMTQRVDAMPDGRSALGLFHTLGNVAEWTSSFLRRYPDGPSASLPTTDPVMVVRGGSATDFDRLRVRPAFRGWRQPITDVRGTVTREYAPDPRVRRPWTGFRCAVYPDTGRSRMPSLEYWAVVNSVLPTGSLETTRYVSSEYRQLIPPGTAVENGIFVPQRAYAFTAVPLKRLAIRFVASTAPTFYSVTRSHGITDTKSLLTAAGDEWPLLLGMVQSDTTISGLVSTRDRRRSDDPRKLFRAVAPAGTYYVGLLHSRLALVTPSLNFVFYLTPKPVTRATVSVLERSAPARGEPMGSAAQSLNTSRGFVGVELEVPLGDGDLAGRVVRVRLNYDADAKIVNAVSPWRTFQAR